jgi:hypothetical protein
MRGDEAISAHNAALVFRIGDMKESNEEWNKSF